MKDVCVDVLGCRALGDTLAVTPTLRKLFNSYGKKISVATHHHEIFKNNPYVDNIFNEITDDIKNDYEVFESFNIGYHPNGVCYKHNAMDIRQFHAVNLGFMLTRDEMSMDYFPDEVESIEGLPEKYVLIHPVQNWNSRTWDEKKWQMLTKLLNERGIAVISVGKDSSELGGSNVDKPVFNFNIDLGLNLMNQTTLSQTWWLINSAMCFITMDSGLLHLAGTTDSEIIQLGSSIHPQFRAPYRKKNQGYKYHYVLGGCGLHCASDMKYGVREWESIQGIPSLVNCLERKETFECHPNPIIIYNKVLEILDLEYLCK
jgi:ADP-heptose:LPS heptosyltransferase